MFAGAGDPGTAPMPLPAPSEPLVGVEVPLPPLPTFIQSYDLPPFFLPNSPLLPPSPANMLLVIFWLAWLCASAAFIAWFFFISFLVMAFSGSGATEPGVAGAALWARDVEEP